MQRRTPRSGKQKKAQLQAERRRRAAGPCEEEAAAASEAQEAAVRAYHVDACGYRWRRSAEDAVLVGMVVQRARGGGVVVRLCLSPDAVTGAAPAAARAAAAAVPCRAGRAAALEGGGGAGGLHQPDCEPEEAARLVEHLWVVASDHVSSLFSLLRPSGLASTPCGGTLPRWGSGGCRATGCPAPARGAG